MHTFNTEKERNYWRKVIIHKLSVTAQTFSNFKFIPKPEKNTIKGTIQTVFHINKTCLIENGKELIHGINFVPKFEFEITIN